jgi:hypothetical protein
VTTFSNQYVVYEIVFYPTTPTPQTLPQSIQIAETTQAAALADVMALYPNAVIVSVGPATQTGAIVLPSAVSAATTSPATLYCVTFYDNALLINQTKMRVVANTQAQAWAVVINTYPNAVAISIAPNPADAPAVINLQTA